MAAAGTRGPVPKRSIERRRRNKESKVETVTVEVGCKVEVPAPETSWHPIARDWYLSLAQSGQAQFYEPSDWQYARFIADAMSRNLKQRQKFSAMLFAAVQSGMTDLLTTEASRRRVRLELERAVAGAAETPASVTAMSDYRKRLGATGSAKRR